MMHSNSDTTRFLTTHSDIPLRSFDGKRAFGASAMSFDGKRAPRASAMSLECVFFLLESDARNAEPEAA